MSAHENPASAAQQPPPPSPSPERAYRDALIRASVGAVSWLALAYVLCRYLGIGGLRFGWLLCAVIIGGGAAAVIWMFGRILPGLSSLVASAAAIGLALGINVASSAAISAPRLGEYLDSLAIEGTVEKEQHAGSVRCDPDCPRITREYRMIYARTSAAQTTIEGRLLSKGAVSEDMVRERDRLEATVREGKVVATFRRDGRQVLATVTMTATRR